MGFLKKTLQALVLAATIGVAACGSGGGGSSNGRSGPSGPEVIQTPTYAKHLALTPSRVIARSQDQDNLDDIVSVNPLAPEQAINLMNASEDGRVRATLSEDVLVETQSTITVNGQNRTVNDLIAINAVTGQRKPTDTPRLSESVWQKYDGEVFIRKFDPITSTHKIMTYNGEFKTHFPQSIDMETLSSPNRRDAPHIAVGKVAGWKTYVFKNGEFEEHADLTSKTIAHLWPQTTTKLVVYSDFSGAIHIDEINPDKTTTQRRIVSSPASSLFGFSPIKVSKQFEGSLYREKTGQLATRMNLVYADLNAQQPEIRFDVSTQGGWQPGSSEHSVVFDQFYIAVAGTNANGQPEVKFLDLFNRPTSTTGNIKTLSSLLGKNVLKSALVENRNGRGIISATVQYGNDVHTELYLFSGGFPQQIFQTAPDAMYLSMSPTRDFLVANVSYGTNIHDLNFFDISFPQGVPVVGGFNTSPLPMSVRRWSDDGNYFVVEIKRTPTGQPRNEMTLDIMTVNSANQITYVDQDIAPKIKESTDPIIDIVPLDLLDSGILTYQATRLSAPTTGVEEVFFYNGTNTPLFKTK